MKIFHVVAIACCAIHIASAAIIEFIDDELHTPMQLITIDDNTSSIIVAARNRVYSLFPENMRLYMKQSTGPKLDHEKCSPILDQPCSWERKPMDDDPKILGVNSNLLFQCGTLYQGSCYISLARNIRSRFLIGEKHYRLSNLAAGRESTVMVFGPGPVQRASLRYMYIGITYDGRPTEYFPPAVSSRRMDLETVDGEEEYYIRYTYNSDKSLTAVNFHPNFRKSYKVNYVYGFSYQKFVFFVTTQRASVTSDVIETRLIRVCTTDYTFFSYMEIPLKCHRGDAYNLATAAYLGQAGPMLKSRLKMEGSSEVLYITFVRTVPDNSYMVDKSKGSVLCSFPMSQVISYFTNATRDCFNVEPRTSLLSHVVGEGIKCKNHTIKIEDDFCGSGLNHYIEGREAIPGGVRGNVDSQVTSLAVTLQRNMTVAFLGTDKGDVIKLMLERWSGLPLYVENIASKVEGVDKAIQKSNIFDKTHQFLYFLTGNKVVKFPAGSCSIYKSCGSCLSSEDPLDCGWCGNNCAHYQECDAHGLFTREFCQPVITDVQPSSGPTAGGTVVTITGDNFSSSESGEASSHIQVSIAGVECEIIVWTKTKLQCRTAPVEKEVSDPVKIRVIDTTWMLGQFDMNGTVTSERKFRYLVPRVTGAIPTYGPISGGTRLEVFGRNLNIGSSCFIIVAGIKCRNVTLTSSKATCTTHLSGGPVSGPIQMTIDSAHLEAKGNFQTWIHDGAMGNNFHYKPDPEIISYGPNVTTTSGTVNITVTGTHFDSVYAPALRLLITIPITGKIVRIDKRCKVLNESLMTCPTPELHLTDIFKPSERAPVLAHYLFKMDGTEWYNTLELHDLPRILYFPDPEYFSFESAPEKVTYSQEELEINGKNLDLAHSPDDVHVLIDGSVPCKVTRIFRESLFCLLPSVDSLPTSNGSLHSVEVHIHPLNFHLGAIEFVEEEEVSSSTATIVICVVLVAMGFAGVMFMYCRRVRRERNKLHHRIAYAEANGNPEVNDYTSCGARPEEPRRPNGNDYTTTRTHVTTRTPSVPATNGPISPLDDETVRMLEVENLRIDKNCLTLGAVLGQGYFGCVYKGILTNPGHEPIEVAVKTLRENALHLGPQVITNFLEEGLMMKDFKHPNILSLIGVCLETKDFPMVVTPYMKYGDLHTYIGDETRDPHVLQLLKFGIDIAKGMAYLAETKFVHRDLAARNCMLDEKMVVKVADFGLSRDIYEKEYYSSDNKKMLPVKWMALESLEKGIYTSSTDVWSYGVVLWELMTRGVLPYPDVDNWDILNFLKSGRRLLQPYCCPELVYIIMLKCWSENPSQRPTFEELVVAMQSAVAKYEEDNRGRQQKVDLNVRYMNSPYRMLEECNLPGPS